MTADDGYPEVGEDEFASELELWESSLASGERSSLADLVNRVLDKGVVISGHVTISVAGIDLIYLGLNAVLTSISGARRRIRDAALPSGTDDDGPA